MATEHDVPFRMVDTHWFEGIPYPGGMPASLLRRIPDTPVYPGDVYVTGYTKSGSIWTMTTVEAILKADNLDHFVKDGVKSNRLPLERLDGYQKHIEMEGPRIVHTHLRYHMLPKDVTNKGKVIQIMRNPRDVAVSYYHFTQINAKDFGNYAGSWATFYDAYMAGHVAWGSWYDYCSDWLKYKDKTNILFIKYEDFHKNPHEIIGTIATFLGKTINADTIGRISEIVSFKSMKNNPGLDVTHEKFKSPFLRKGVVGDWRNYFTPEQEEGINQMYQKFKEETGVEFEFK